MLLANMREEWPALLVLSIKWLLVEIALEDHEALLLTAQYHLTFPQTLPNCHQLLGQQLQHSAPLPNPLTWLNTR